MNESLWFSAALFWPRFWSAVATTWGIPAPALRLPSRMRSQPRTLRSSILTLHVEQLRLRPNVSSSSERPDNVRYLASRS